MVEPLIKGTNETVPCNAMNWKYFEMRKFAKRHSNGEINLINGKLSNKEQWLSFFCKCGKVKSIPDDVVCDIQKAYKIMFKENWKLETLEEYYKVIQEEANKPLSLSEVELKGEIKGEILLIKALLDLNIKKEEITKYLKFLTDYDAFGDIEEYIKYIKEHNQDTDSDIFDKLGLVYCLSDFLNFN